MTLETYASTPAQSITYVDSTDAIPPTLEDFITAQSASEFCQIVARQLSQAETEFTLDKEEVFIRRTAVEEALQKLVLQSLRQRLYNLSNHSGLSGHRGQRRMYGTMQRNYFWPNMATNMYKTVSNCNS